MAAPTPLDGGAVYKIQIIYGQGKAGWSDTVFFHLANPDVDKALEAGGILASLRRKVSAAATRVEGVRASRIDGVREFRAMAGNDIPDSETLVGTTEFPSKAWFVRMSDISGSYHRSMWFRGMTSVINTYNSASYPTDLQKPDLIKGSNQIKKCLINKLPDVQALGQWVIRAYARETPPMVEATPLLVGIDADTHSFKLTVPAVLGMSVGSYIRIRGYKGPGTAGLNGAARVIKIVPDPPPATTSVITVNRTPRCAGTIIVTKVGKIRISAFQYYPIAEYHIERISTKRVGRPFFGFRGARHNKSC